MENSSLESIFIPVSENITPLLELTRKEFTPSELRHLVAELHFNTAYDFVRSAALRLSEEGKTEEAINRIEQFDMLVTRKGDSTGKLLDIHAALMQILTALYIRSELIEEAKGTAAATLTLLASSPKRRDEPFLAVLASLLHDISILHYNRSEYRQAEREIEKSMKIFERLAKQKPERYASAYMLTQSVSTIVMRSKAKQATMLATHQQDTENYLQMLDEGIEGAASRLVDSLAEQGRTLARMDKHRDAIQFYMRALKYLTGIESDFTNRQLKLSVDLGESLLNVKTTRDKGIHLLNTMLHKASKLHSDDEHRRIVDILAGSRSNQLDILGFWYKLFPK